MNTCKVMWLENN